MAAASRRDVDIIDVSPSRGWRPRLWLVRHAQALLFTCGVLARRPLATFLTTAVIAVALALPCTLVVLLDNVRAATDGWERGAGLSLFLRQDVDDAAAARLAREIGALPGVAATRVITREQALAEFRELSGFAEVTDAFAEQNPLPAVVVVEPAAGAAQRAGAASLLSELEVRPEVDFARLDLAWLERLGALIDIAERGVAVLAAVLAAGVILVIGNTLRLGIENRREEIEIAKLFGATDGFIRRPFLWSGLLYGALGATLAWLLVAATTAALTDPVRRLASLYDSGFGLTGPGAREAAVLLVVGGALGLAGSWLSVGRHLSAIEPR
ncbi:MAG: permease-like cell division protein FtsX [Gammaproteobacteria bacterium]|nr:permease-like cell division protein FtsX [Gammaproteobacteria bacterium]